MEITKAINAYPSGQTRALYSAYPAYNNIVQVQSERILEMMNKVMKQQNIKGNIARYGFDF